MQAPGAAGLCRLQQWRRDAQEQVLVTMLRLLMPVVRQGNEPEPEEEDQGDGDAVLVTEADSPIGEQIVLQLILAR